MIRLPVEFPADVALTRNKLMFIGAATLTEEGLRMWFRIWSSGGLLWAK
jgi:hypothetical protein